MSTPFWQSKTLDQMTEAEWESLCDGCGKCCLHKLMDEDTDEIYYTNVACSWLNSDTCSCKDYPNRFSSGEECLKLTRDKIEEFNWLPDTCAYRLLGNGQTLQQSKNNNTRSQYAMLAPDESVRGKIVYEVDVIDWEDHIVLMSRD